MKKKSLMIEYTESLYVALGEINGILGGERMWNVECILTYYNKVTGSVVGTEFRFENERK